MPDKQKKILIAEDEKPMARALELKLKKAGFDALAVFNGEDALVQLKKEKYDLLVLDLIMPRLDGFGLMEGVKEQGIKIKMVVASNLGQENDIKKAKDLGAVDFFIKADVSITEIVDKIKNILSS